MSVNAVSEAFFNDSYERHGLAAQRRYPNEEFLRFLGRHFFDAMPREQRRGVRALEVGCGSGANLWALAREGFETYGIDLSTPAIALCKSVLAEWGQRADVRVADMTALPFPDAHFDVIADVFSSYCFDEAGFGRLLGEVARTLKPGGLFFSYTPSKGSDAFKDRGTATHVDASTLNGITRESAPFSGSAHPFRFITPTEYDFALGTSGFDVVYTETTGRTYRRGAEYFEFVVIVGKRR